MIIDDLMDSLEEKAGKATQGRWEAVDDVMGGNFVMIVDGGDPIAETERPRDMRYIAEASPENILKLIAYTRDVLLTSENREKAVELWMKSCREAEEEVIRLKAELAKVDKQEDRLLETVDAIVEQENEK